jgi:twinkle protein
LFGRDRFDPGSAPAVIITEGEEDAAAARDILGEKYAIVSVQSGSSAKADVTADREWLNSFNKIYLCLDNDDVGKKATKEIARVFNYNKVYHIPLSKFKDANDYLINGAAEDFRLVFYGSKRFMPEGIVSSWSEFRDILKGQLEKPIGTYPFQQLGNMARGLREGEIVLFDAPEGVGKTEIIRAMEYHLLRTTDHNIGCIHLEESKKRQLLGLVGLSLQQPLHLDEDITLNEEGIFEELKKLTKRDDRLHIYSHFGSEDPDVLLDAIRVLVGALNCKFVFLDHITQIVTGLKLDDERRVLDYLATRLAMMVEELNFCLILISHVNDDGQTRGSRLIAKAADLRVSLVRDVENEDPFIRNTTRLLVRKNRWASSTGPAGNLYFDPVSFTLSENEPPRLPPVNP